MVSRMEIYTWKQILEWWTIVMWYYNKENIYYYIRVTFEDYWGGGRKWQTEDIELVI